MNTVKKGTRKSSKVMRSINVFLLMTTLLLSVAGMTVKAAEQEEKIVLKIKIVTEEVPEESETEDVKSEIDSIEVEENSDDAMMFSDSPKEDILDTLSETELYYFAECLEIETNGECMEGKVAAASVLVNRVQSDSFPNTYEAVVSQKVNGVLQFSSYDSSIWGSKTITEETYEAIRTVLRDGSSVGDATYFANLDKLSGGWFFTAQENGTLIKVAKIGGHTFFRTN